MESNIFVSTIFNMIEYVTLELRPRLQTCNAFVRLSKEVNSTKIKIKLLEESIEVTIGNSMTTILTKFVKLIPTSLSSLSITNNWICFRAQTKSDSVFGSFKTEVISNSALNWNIVNPSVKSTELQNEDECSVMCSCCKNILTRKISVKRILPIPDMHYDPSDWFCCKHSQNSSMPSLSPLESDIFYGQFFFIIHTSSFNQNLKRNEDSIVCSRCLQYVGKVFTNNSMKLWSCAIDYNLLNRAKIQSATNPLSDFLIAIKTSMTGMMGEEIVLQSFIGKEIHCLILKPMDLHLNLMIESEPFTRNNVETLQKVSVIKVLYKYETSKDITDSGNKTYCEVSFLVIRTGLEHLSRSTKRFPHIYRIASDFYIGYIYLENPESKT